jgi:chromate transporter
MSGTNTSITVARVPLREIFRVMGMIGISSFGGGVSGWMYRVVVEERKWLSEVDFLTGMSLARAMPGTNVANLSVWIGYRLRKGPGAVAALCGMLSGPIVLIIICAMLYKRWGQSLMVHRTLLGIVAASLGLSISMCLMSWRAAATSVFYGLVVLLTFFGVGLLHWPMLPVVAVLAPISIVWSYFKERSR